eukprot:147451-Prymnesium_polylepis.1
MLFACPTADDEGTCWMLVHLMHAGTERARGSPKCARDGLRRPSHRIRYAHRQLSSIEKILSGEGTLIAAPQTRQDPNRMILGTKATIDLLTDVFARVRML